MLEELARRGHGTIPEPGRRIVRAELENGGTALPWADVRAFVDRIVALARADYAAASGSTGCVFFDRGLFDAVSALAQVSGTSIPQELLRDYPYHRQVFLVPPWREIHVNDTERRHGFAEAEAEYHRLAREYEACGYQTIVLPRLSVEARADFVEQTLGIAPRQVLAH